MPRLSAVLAIAVFAWGASAEYVLVDDYAPRTFFNKFDFFTEGDPTGGTVRYQSRENAERLGLITTTEESSIIDVDYENVSPNGRAAVRLESKTSYQKGLLVVDVKHMPGGICGVWPALWTLGSGTWPNHGEIDIIEGVNIQKQNLMTLHTSSGCTIDGQNSYSGGGGGITNTPGTNFKPSGVRFTGNLTTANCDVKAPGQSANMGCQFEAPQNPRKLTPRYDEDEEEDEDSDSSDAVYAPTYGPAFNKNGGGIFAMEWTTDGIKIFFFPHKRRQDLHPMLRTATDDSRWGDPQAHFKGSGCDFERHFQMHRIVLNTDFCGEWAGQPHIWQEGCAAKTGSSTCQEYVINNPEAFKEAYWEIRSMRWYQWNGG
ncbi:glycoside hydrolase family 16 protein, partial [Aplosporella prunicola CBS 121167]